MNTPAGCAATSTPSVFIVRTAANRTRWSGTAVVRFANTTVVFASMNVDALHDHVDRITARGRVRKVTWK